MIRRVTRVPVSSSHCGRTPLPSFGMQARLGAVMILGLLGGCYRGNGGDGGDGGAATDGDDATGSAGASADSGSAGDDGPAPVDCEAGAYGPRRLRLLTRREYHQTIVDLL